MSVDFVIAVSEVAALLLHRFEDRVHLLHFHFLNGAFEIVFVFTEVRLLPTYLYIYIYIYEFMNVPRELG